MSVATSMSTTVLTSMFTTVFMTMFTSMFTSMFTTVFTSMSTIMTTTASAINSKEGLDLVPNIFTQQGDSEIEGHLATNDETSRQCCGYSN